ncbi:pyrroline-5-carboxylate reductase [Aurantivibrio plasticivorans]
MSNPAITFIGGGNMASSIIGGLVAEGYDAKAITVSDPVRENLEQLNRDFGVHVTSDNQQAVANAAAVVLAVKPQVMKTVCSDLSDALQQPLIISIAAGITAGHLQQWLGGHLPIVRCMPNTPALVQLGASGLYANEQCEDNDKQLAERVLSAVGIVEWLDSETLIDAVTAISGSGPAYFFLMMEAMIAAGVKQGLPQETASRLAIQTCLGAGKLASESDVEPAELRRRVSSPGGTTLKALESFEHDDFHAVVERAMAACAARAEEMANELS